MSNCQNNLSEGGASYSIIAERPKIDDHFIEWFVGISDAESNFLIRTRKNKEGSILGFEFIFRIALHYDDKNVLEFIKATLGCGRIDTSRDTLVYTISKLDDVEKILIPLFEHFHLNTKKHLDYLVFQKAFYMFITRKTAGLNRQDLHRDIVQLKEVMNSKRVDFDFPGDHESRIKITSNYLVGLIEGDGSFYLNKTGMTARVSLVTIRQDKILLEKIREFLLSQLDEHSCMLGSSTKLINIHDKRVGDNKPISILEIY